MSSRLLVLMKRCDSICWPASVAAAALDAAVEAEVPPYLSCAPGAVAAAKAQTRALGCREIDDTETSMPSMRPLAALGEPRGGRGNRGLLWQTQTQLGETGGVTGGAARLWCTNPVGDSSRESSVVAGGHEQTHTPRLQDQERARVSSHCGAIGSSPMAREALRAPRLADDLVRPRHDLGSCADRQARPSARLQRCRDRDLPDDEG